MLACKILLANGIMQDMVAVTSIDLSTWNRMRTDLIASVNSNHCQSNYDPGLSSW